MQLSQSPAWWGTLECISFEPSSPSERGSTQVTSTRTCCAVSFPESREVVLSSFLDRVFEISVNVLTAVPFHYMLTTVAALWICLVILILIDV